MRNSWEAGSWSRWRAADYGRSGGRFWAAEPVDVAYDLSKFKNLRCEWQVRCVGNTESTRLLVGGSATCACYAPFMPALSIGKLGWSPDGLRVEYSSDYGKGTNYVRVESVKSGKAEILLKPYESQGNDSSSTFLVPQSSLRRRVEDGEELTVTAKVGTDQLKWFWKQYSATLPAPYDSGSSALEIEVSDNGDGTLVATVAELGTTHAYIAYGDRMDRLEYLGTAGGKSSYLVPYPFGTPYSIYAASVSKDGDTWGTASLDMPASKERMHAWTAGKVHVALKVTDDGGGLVDSYTEEADAESYRLVGREHEHVQFGGTYGGSLPVTGASLDQESDYEAFRNLLRAHYALYRSPAGHTYEVAVKSVSFGQRPGYMAVKVDQVQEG